MSPSEDPTDAASTPTSAAHGPSGGAAPHVTNARRGKILTALLALLALLVAVGLGLLARGDPGTGPASRNVAAGRHRFARGTATGTCPGPIRHASDPRPCRAANQRTCASPASG
jgi:hypothetical protein